MYQFVGNDDFFTSVTATQRAKKHTAGSSDTTGNQLLSHVFILYFHFMFVWHICLFLLLAFPRTHLARTQAKHQRLETAPNLQKHEMLATVEKATLWIILVFSPFPKEEPPAGCIIKSLILKLFPT